MTIVRELPDEIFCSTLAPHVPQEPSADPNSDYATRILTQKEWNALARPRRAFLREENFTHLPKMVDLGLEAPMRVAKVRPVKWRGSCASSGSCMLSSCGRACRNR